MKSLVLMLGVIAIAVASTFAQASFQRKVTVSGLSTAGSAFTLDITSSTDSRSIPMGPLVVDYTASAMASLMVSAINDDYRANGNTGFEAFRIKKADERTEISETFVITSSSLITDIAIGPSGGAVSAPRAPGIAFNPILIDQEADQPTPYLGSQFGHPNANLRLNGLDPAINHFRKVEVLLDGAGFGDLNLEINGLPNVPIMFLGGPYGDGFTTSPNGVFALYAGSPDQQTLDIGVPNPGGGPPNLQVIADGIFNLGADPGLNAFFQTNASGNFTFPTFTVQVTPGFSGDGFQAILPDPSLPAPGLRFTQAVQPVYDTGRRREIVVNSDGVAQISFLPGNTFDFYSLVGEPQINLFENGFLTFGTASPPQGGATVDVFNQLQADPSIFVNWADWQLPALMGGGFEGVDVYEFGDEIRFGWGFSENATGAFGHAADSDAARFECILRLRSLLNPAPGSGSISFDFANLDAAATFANDSVIGISPGGSPLGVANLDLSLNRFAPAAGVPLLEQAVAGGSMPSSVISLSSGLGPNYSNGSGLDGRMLEFFPAPASLPGTAPYASIASEAKPNDVARVRAGADSIQISVGAGQFVELIGYFLYAYDRGGLPQVQVTLDPASSVFNNPVTLAPGAVGQATNDNRLNAAVPTFLPGNGFRSYEQLRLPIPDLSSALIAGVTLPQTVGLTVNFAGRAPIQLPNAITINP